MELLKKILSSSLWLLIGNSIGRLAMFLANIFAARILSQEEYGQFGMIRNTISSIESIVSGTLGSTIIKKVSEIKHNEEKQLPYLLSTIFIINLSITIIVSIFIIINVEFIIKNFFLNNSTLINALYIGVLILVATTLSTMFQNILVGLEEFKKLATLSIFSSIISIPIIFLLTYFIGLYGALFSISFYFIFDYCIKYVFYKKLNYTSKFNISIFKKEIEKIILFSLPLLFAVIINSFSFWYARILLINKTNSFKEIAIFDASFQWLTIIMIITGATTSVALPMLSKIKNNQKELSIIFNINLLINLLISILIAIIFILFSSEIMSIYGENYKIGNDTLIILSITSIFFTLATIYNRYMVSRNRTWMLFVAAIVGSISMFTYLYINNDILSSELLAKSILIYFFSGSLFYIIKYQLIKKELKNDKTIN